jgi:hypothetical protein
MRKAARCGNNSSAQHPEHDHVTLAAEPSRHATRSATEPLLDTYRQMAIRQQKQRDWEACKWWAERGLALYGERAAREEAVEDLIKRRNRSVAKLEAAAIPRRQTPLASTSTAIVAATRPGGMPGTTESDAELEVLICHECGRRFERMRVRGRKPTLCPTCRSSAET